MQDRNAAIGALYEKEYDVLCRAAYRAIGDWEAAQDLVQDTFLLALLRQDGQHPSPGGWLTQTLGNLIRNERRKLVTRDTIPLESLDLLPADEAPPPLDDLLPPSLSARERELLLLRFEAQLSYRELGQRFGISEGACRIKVFRIIEKCRREMQ